MKICVVSSYIPMECGIATFAANLIEETKQYDASVEFFVVAVADSKGYSFPRIVKHIVDKGIERDYIEAAEYINKSDADVVLIEHEFGIFGGETGKFIVSLMEKLTKPFVTTLHTVPIKLPAPYPYATTGYSEKIKLLPRIIELSDAVTIMVKSSKKYLEEKIPTSRDKIAVIPHGVPHISQHDIGKYKKLKTSLGFGRNDFVLTTFGLVHQKKGIDYAIKAMPEILRDNPRNNVKYLITGTMQLGKPKEYIDYLKNLVVENGVVKNVIFETKYLSYEKIYQLLANTDIHITPYLSRGQSSSGTLSYAMAAGCCIVSTPFVFAKEVIERMNVGEFIEFKDEHSISRVISSLIKDKDKLEKYQKNAYKASRNFLWSDVAKKFVFLFTQLIKEKK